MRLLIQKESKDIVRSSGIIIPSSARNESKYKQGVVIKIGNDLETTYPNQIAVGDSVMYNENMADKIELEIDGDLTECAICEYKRDVHIIITSS